jgi:hypothetical protein
MNPTEPREGQFSLNQRGLSKYLRLLSVNNYLISNRFKHVIHHKRLNQKAEARLKATNLRLLLCQNQAPC